MIAPVCRTNYPVPVCICLERRLQEFRIFMQFPCSRGYALASGETSLIRAIVSFDPLAQAAIHFHANPQAYRHHPGLARRSCLRFRRGQQERSLSDFAARGRETSFWPRRASSPRCSSSAAAIGGEALPDGCSFCCGACHRCRCSARMLRLNGASETSCKPTPRRREASGGTSSWDTRHSRRWPFWPRRA